MVELCVGVDSMKAQTGYLYHIKDEFFDRINNKGLMINHENGHSRPSYLAIKDDDILWFIPLSTKIEKYRTIIEKKEKKYGSCKTILIKKIAGKELSEPQIKTLINTGTTPIIKGFVSKAGKKFDTKLIHFI